MTQAWHWTARWKLIMNRIDDFTHVICPGLLKVLTEKVDAICWLNHPGTVMELQSIRVYATSFAALYQMFAVDATSQKQTCGGGLRQNNDGLAQRRNHRFGTDESEIYSLPALAPKRLYVARLFLTESHDTNRLDVSFFKEICWNWLIIPILVMIYKWRQAR